MAITGKKGIIVPDTPGKVVAVTGASSGIGLATAEALAQSGAKVVLASHDPERLGDAAARLAAGGADVLAQPTDVTKRADLDSLISAAIDRFGRLDVLVSNAGISKLGLITGSDPAAWDAMIDVNLRGVLYGIAAALPVFRRQGQGHFVTTVSTSGLWKISPEQAIYSATKNAVRTVMEGMRGESTDGVIRTTSISPGYVRTRLADSVDNPTVREQIQHNMDQHAISPAAIASAIRYAIEQPDDVEISEMTIRPTRQN